MAGMYSIFNELGYKVHFRVLNAKDYGIPHAMHKFYGDAGFAVRCFITKNDRRRIGIKDNQQIPMLPIVDERLKYLEYHNRIVYKG